MATENPFTPVSREAGGTIRRRRFVKDAAGGKVVECSVAGEAACGINRDAADTVNHNEVAVFPGGDIIVESGAAVADLALVATDDQGRAVTAVPGDAILGKVKNGTSSSAAGQMLSIEFYSEPQELLA